MQRSKLLSNLDLSTSKGVEFGPLTSPMVTKAESDITYVDRLDRQRLQARYESEPNVVAEHIIEPDVVWEEGTSLADCLSGAGPLDYALASHVIEHVPDFIGFLAELEGVLQVEGRLALIIPDKRYTFDFLRRTSSVSEMIDCHLRRSCRPTPAQIFDFFSSVGKVDPVLAWQNRIDVERFEYYANAPSALWKSRDSLEKNEFVDVHCWVFTPASFLDSCAQLASLGLMRLACARFYDTEENDIEFGLLLERSHAEASPSDIARSFTEALHQVRRTSP